jgi:hypothetical protein
MENAKESISNFIKNQNKTNKFSYIGFPDTFYIYHITNIDNIQSILKSYKLYNQNDRKRHSITHTVGEGVKNRNTCNAYNYIINKPNQGCDEAIGVYFRISLSIDNIYKKLKPNKCALIFSADLLDFYDWHINLCENNGFYINNKEVPFGDCDPEYRISYTKNQRINSELDKIDLENVELIIYETVELTYCYNVITL